MSQSLPGSSGTSVIGHKRDVWYSIRANGWYVECSCGWQATFVKDTPEEAAAAHAAHVHAEGGH